MIPPQSLAAASARGGEVILQPRHQLDQVARPVAVVELGRDDLPAVAAGAGRAWQREQIGSAGNAGGGATLDGRGADLLVAHHAEQLAEAGDLLLINRVEGLGRDVAAGDAGAARRNDNIDGRIGNPGLELGDDRALVVLDDALGRELVARSLDQLGQGLAGFVGGFVAAVGNRQDRDVDGQEGALLTDWRRHGDYPALGCRERYRSAIDPRQAHRARVSAG